MPEEKITKTFGSEAGEGIGCFFILLGIAAVIAAVSVSELLTKCP